VAIAADAPVAPSADDGLDLGAWLRETTPEESTRMTTAQVPQSGDEAADFDATLRAFTAGVRRTVDHEDFDSHYDLGVAFREMGLVDEAIVQFQRAAQAPGRPLRALEALGQCFLDAGQPELALSTLARPAAAAADHGTGDASLVAVHYLMGAAAQALGRSDDARRWLVRVVATDVRFRDASDRLAALPPPTPTR
jgi:tetratricopeptide (TPR) repeat protein